ncbi:MAG: outer membrane beta-barrel protein [Candidatus Devosia phytovorans]|uniref:Outer membrane beta-barrel protein n=1 Tax=Candidatus Devosia phytovorans TaxID=3121372 RepID=A0AAJ6AZC3_9HYPH|nr:outer membrane beta-barrel protein [Devosia sp.]WEK03651.1 MAG: outer membrane beta-barrel protein [Devosia sp.]
MSKSVSTASVLALILVAGASSAAMAADLPLATAPIAPSYNSLDVAIATDDWTGFYVGASIGGATTDDFDEANSAWTGGVQAGYLQQFGTFVVGGELSASLSDDLYYQIQPGAGLQESWAIEAKGRAGVALDQTLIYGTAGIALSELEAAGATTSEAETYAGAVFGAGIEQGLGNGWSLRAEYTQTRYWDVDSTIGGIASTDDLTKHAITAGVNYRF